MTTTNVRFSSQRHASNGGVPTRPDEGGLGSQAEGEKGERQERHLNGVREVMSSDQLFEVEATTFLINLVIEIVYGFTVTLTIESNNIKLGEAVLGEFSARC